MDEYVDYAVRLHVLLSFFDLAPNALVRHKLCDLAFTSHMRPSQQRKGRGVLRFTPAEPDDFVYWYSRPDEGAVVDNQSPGNAGASTGVDVTGSEKALAHAGRTVVDDALGDGYMEEEQLAFFLSAIRQGMEQELVQLRLLSASPKLAVIDDVCARHVDLLLATHPLRETEGGQRFRDWCVTTARGPILQGLLKLLAFDLPRRRGSARR